MFGASCNSDSGCLGLCLVVGLSVLCVVLCEESVGVRGQGDERCIVGLTSRAFLQEAHKMVREANIKQSTAEKQLKEALNKVRTELFTTVFYTTVSTRLLPSWRWSGWPIR